MASRKQKKVVTASAGATNPEQTSTAPAVSTTKKKTKKAAVRPAATPKRRGPGRPKGSKNTPHALGKPSAKKSARSRRYTPAERARILAAAKQEGLSGPAAAKKFGVSQLTFYTWRKRAEATRERTPGRPARPESDGFSQQVRDAVRARVQEMLPEIIAQEINSHLGGRAGRSR